MPACPLGGLALAISYYLTDSTLMLALMLILRRCSEWISEIHLARKELEKDYYFALWFIAVQFVLLIVAIVSVTIDSSISTLGVALWATAPALLSLGFLATQLRIGDFFDLG